MAIVVNKPIPEFESNATGGIKVSNTSHLGKTVILYFYPKDNTPGCTTEAMQFRDKYKDFVKAGATVFGVSRDNMKSHDEFKAKLQEGVLFPKRLGAPAEFATLVLELVANSYMNAVDVRVDGGIRMPPK